MSTEQKALFLNKPHGDFVIGLADIHEPGPGEIQVEVHSAALNPVDWIVRQVSALVPAYPAILGCDAAGIVKKVGEGVTNVGVGDEVLFCGRGTLDDRQATFKQYTVTSAGLVAKKPSNLTFDQAATVPLTMATAAMGLYGKKSEITSGAELYPPWEDGGRGKYNGQPILIVGAGSNVGCHAIQFAKLSGFSPIIVTASKTKEAYLKSIGATHVIDRHAPLPELSFTVKKITGEPVRIIYDAVSRAETENAAYDVLAPGGKMIIFPNFAIDKSKLTSDKEILVVNGSFNVPAQRELGLRLYTKLTGLLEAGDIKPSDAIEVLPGGLGGISGGLEKLQAGTMSVSKFVVHPQETL